jgi:5'-nucleotidase
MRILVTNDDGFGATGIKILTSVAQEFGDVYICAPAEQHSGASQSTNLSTKFNIEQRSEKEFITTGTPTDCVSMALQTLNISPDVVLSGVNKGLNYGTLAYYSGTVGAAREGAIYGVPAVALSTDYKFNPEGVAVYTHIVLEEIFGYLKRLKKATLFNVNIPNLFPSQIKGTKVTRMSRSTALVRWAQDEHGDIDNAWEGEMSEDPDPESDVNAVKKGFVSITPLLIDATDDELFRSLRHAPE